MLDFTIRKSSLLSPLLLFFLMFSGSLQAQEIECAAFVMNTDTRDYTRISYDNDLFVGKDRYYTQGIGVDVFLSCLAKNPMNVLMLRLKDSDPNEYGIQFRTHGCTPTSILSDSVLSGDRPFAGVFSFGITRRSARFDRALSMTSALQLGMIGEAALGKQTQTGIHRITGNDLPLGWQHQIKNAPIVNYTVRLEKSFLQQDPAILYIGAFGQVKIGTFQTQLSTGLDLSYGFRNDRRPHSRRRFKCYLYSQSSVVLVGYDASLMGGIVNRDGYHLSYSQINPLVAKQHVGIVFGVPHFGVAVDFAFISREIRQGLPHSWGGLKLLFW